MIVIRLSLLRERRSIERRSIDSPEVAMKETVPALSASADTRPRPTSRFKIQRRRLVLGIAGSSALVAGVQFHRTRLPQDRVEAGVTVHGTPRALPVLRFRSDSGEALSLESFRGRVVLLNLWATWCAPCREEMPTLDRLQSILGGRGFEVLALSLDGDGAAAVRPFFTQIGIRHLRTYYDSFGDAGVLVGTGVPLTLVIDAQGQEVARKLGAAHWDAPGIQTLIRRFILSNASR